jgi:excinuclease ABC subunit C
VGVDLKKIPNTPGVYKFFSNQEIIYIGKAKNLRNRVSSYFGNAIKDRKTSQIKSLTNKIETFTTKNELEALLLEQMLIKENKPKFNILLRDDKTYPYIYFSSNHDFPGINLKRTKQAVDANFFGPFVNASAVKKSIREIQKIFRLRNCNDSTFSNRSRPCIEYQMKKCSAPCVQKISKTDYYEDVVSAKSYLSSSDTQTISRLNSEIKIASKNLEFERAADIRDKLKRLELLREEQSVVTISKDVDIFSVHSEDNYIGICIVVVRRGTIRGTKTHLVKRAYFESMDDIYQSVIMNFYENQMDIPKKILCTDILHSKELLKKVFKKKFNARITINHTPNKKIRSIYNLCKINARQVIHNHLSKEDKYNFAFCELQSVISIKKPIKKIEAYDVSHISSDNAVASCIVFSDSGPLKKDYRLFNIPSELAGNDVGSLKHVLERRLKYYKDEDNRPDIILIDGGRNQLNFAMSVIKSSEYQEIKVISIVKGSERVRATETILSEEGIVEFNKNSKSFLLLQEIRNESHRFAIMAQRRKKRLSIKKSKLDDINGIGEVIKQRLLSRFKSIRRIKSANIQDLMTVKGINAKIAQSIKEKL